MRLKNLCRLILLSVTLPLAQAHANIGVEPYLGFGFLTSVTSTNGNTTATGTYSGLAVGGRITFGFLDMFWAGADASYFPTMGLDGSSTFNSGVNNLRVGAVGGLEFPLLPLRAWLGCQLIDQYSGIHSSGGYSSSIATASFKIGAGFKLIPLLSLNAEYFFSSLTARAPSVLGDTSDTKGNMLLLSVSAPFQF